MIYVWALKVILIPFLLWLFVFVFFVLIPVLYTSGLQAAGLGVIFWWSLYGAIIIFLGYVWAYLFHGFYRWRLGDEEIKIWRGIVFRKRITIPYMRVQNVNVVRGPLLLLFGLSGVEVETAGQKASYSGLYTTEGYLPGLVEGEAVADNIVERVKKKKGEEGV